MARGREKRHGESHTPLHNLWMNMKQRCSNPRNKRAERYSQRGILVCFEWSVYETFRDWAVSHGYEPGLQIDRIDNDGNYEPNNCRFVEPIAQQNNRSDNIHLTLFGETKTLAQWSRDPRCMTSFKNLSARIRNGWSAGEAVTLPLWPKRKQYE